MQFLPSFKLKINTIKISNLFLSFNLKSYVIRAVLFFLLAQKKNMQVFSVSIKDIEKTFASMIKIDPKIVLPTKYHKFFDIFSYIKSQKLFEPYIYNYKIMLLDEKRYYLDSFTKYLKMN